MDVLHFTSSIIDAALWPLVQTEIQLVVDALL